MNTLTKTRDHNAFERSDLHTAFWSTRDFPYPSVSFSPAEPDNSRWELKEKTVAQFAFNVPLADVERLTTVSNHVTTSSFIKIIMKIITKWILPSAMLLALTCSLSAGTQDHSHASDREADDLSELFTSSLIAVYGKETGKLISLAREFSEEQLVWAPSEGVFTGQAVLEHLISANYFLGSMLGKELPEGINPQSIGETLSGKEETIVALENSIHFVKSAIEDTSSSDLAEEIEFFGNKMPKMAVAIIVASHAMEHLGQMIAYARTNGIVPPWSRPQSGNEGS